MTAEIWDDCSKCKLDGEVFYGKKDRNTHFIEKHPDIVQGLIEHSDFERKTPRQQLAWAAGFAAFLNCKECEDKDSLKE